MIVSLPQHHLWRTGIDKNNFVVADPVPEGNSEHRSVPNERGHGTNRSGHGKG